MIAAIGEDTATVTWDDRGPNFRVVPLSDVQCFDAADGGAALHVDAHSSSENQRRKAAAAAGQSVQQPRAAVAAAGCAEYEQLGHLGTGFSHGGRGDMASLR